MGSKAVFPRLTQERYIFSFGEFLMDKRTFANLIVLVRPSKIVVTGRSETTFEVTPQPAFARAEVA